MSKKVVLLFGCLLLMLGLRSQCPNRDSLWQQINYLKDYSSDPPAHIRQALLRLEKQMQPCPYWHDSTHVLLLRAIATTWYNEGNYLQAIKYLQQSIALIRHKPGNPAINERELVRVYYWLAVSYQLVNNVTERMKALDSCINVGNRLGYIDRSLLAAIYEKAEYNYDLGDYYHCSEYSTECERKAFQYLPSANSYDSSAAISYVLSSFVWRVNSLTRMKRYAEAEALLNRQVGTQAANNLTAYRGTFYGIQAEMELHKGNYARSEQIFRQALAVERRPLSRKQLLNTLASEVYFKHQRDHDKALSVLKKALDCHNKDTTKYKEDSIESLSIWSNIGEIYAQKGMYDAAFRSFRQALDHIRPGITIADIVNSPPQDFIGQKKIHHLTSLLIEQGKTWRRKYAHTRNSDDLREAITIYKRADQLVNRIKGEQSNLNSKLFWRSNSHGLYEQALEACYTANAPEDAFYFFEKSRAVLLNDQLAEQRWMGEQDILQQTQARKRINTLTRKLDDKSLPADKRADLEKERTSNQQLLASLTNTIKTRNPFYYQSFIDSNFISLQQVKHTILKEYGALIEVFSGDSAVYVMTISAQDTRLRKIDKKAYDHLASLFVQYITDHGLQNSQFETFTGIAHQLYQLIFQNEQLPAGRLIISPDGPYFPFEALQTGTQPNSWLLKDHAISYTYSARYLLNDFAGTTSKEVKSFMGFAPVQYAGTQLPELNESDRSLEALTGYFSGADNFIGKRASKNNFLQHFTDYRIIQLYTHAMDNRDRGEPVIYFADSLLYLSDLVSDKKPATSLVVLSACETGTGNYYQGEGVFSFNRGFAAMGIPAAITSLWKADNRKTYTLTTLFYKYLSQGEPVDVALQQAKLEFMGTSAKENTLPYFWAVPVLTGKVTAIPVPSLTPWWLIIPAIALGMIGLVLLLRWWRGRREGKGLQAMVE